jgi:hypothetical protein
MKQKFSIRLVTALMLMLTASPPLAFSQEKVDGKVIKTNLTACSVVPGKVGTCEGTLILENMRDGKPNQMTVKVTRDTALKKGDEKVFLFQLDGALVTVTFAEKKDEKMAQSVVAKGR